MCDFVLSGLFFFSSRRRHTRCALVTGVQTCALPILEREVLEISNTKFGKDRLVPFGPKLAARLREYRLERERQGRICTGAHHLFSWNGRTPISTNSIRNTFRDDLLPQLHLTVPPGCFGPHVHGLRHSFAVRTLLGWSRQGLIPSYRLHHLSPHSEE